MAELAEFVHHGAGRITPQTLQRIYKKMPMLKVSIAEMEAQGFPHLVEQLQFLANLIEDFADNKADEVPYVTIASAAFAIIYNCREFDLIPDSLPEIGKADDSAVVRVVLIEHERILARYAEKVGTNWRKITLEP